MFKFFALFFVSTFVFIEAKPGLLDTLQDGLKTGVSSLFSPDCKPIKDDSCAIVYDDEDCEEGDWEPLSIKADGQPVSFSTNPLKVNPVQLLKNRKYKDDIESLVVRKGCTLTAYKESDCTGAQFNFKASKDEDLVYEELEDSDADEFDEKIECLKCTCN